MRWRANAVGKCAGEQMPLANALEISVVRLQAGVRRVSGGYKLASAVGCRASAVGRLQAGVGCRLSGGCKLACVGCRAAVSWRRLSAVGRLPWGVTPVAVKVAAREAAMGRYPRGGLSGGCVRLRFFLLLVRACVLGCERLRSA